MHYWLKCMNELVLYGIFNHNVLDSFENINIPLEVWKLYQ